MNPELQGLSTLAGVAGTWVVLAWLLIRSEMKVWTLQNRLDQLTDKIMSRNDDLTAAIASGVERREIKSDVREREQQNKIDTGRFDVRKP